MCKEKVLFRCHCLFQETEIPAMDSHCFSRLVEFWPSRESHLIFGPAQGQQCRGGEEMGWQFCC